MGRPRRGWEDNIRMDLEEIGINAGNWVDSAQDIKCLNQIISENKLYNLRLCTFTFHNSD